MLYQQDISEAFYRKDVRAIEATFCALVGYPNEGGVEEPDSALLIECCRLLADDEGVMPSGTIDIINDVTGAETAEGLLYGSTYAAGAGRVWQNIERFAPAFGEALDG